MPDTPGWLGRFFDIVRMNPSIKTDKLHSLIPEIGGDNDIVAQAFAYKKDMEGGAMPASTMLDKYPKLINSISKLKEEPIPEPLPSVLDQPELDIDYKAGIEWQPISYDIDSKVSSVQSYVDKLKSFARKPLEVDPQQEQIRRMDKPKLADGVEVDAEKQKKQQDADFKKRFKGPVDYDTRYKPGDVVLMEDNNPAMDEMRARFKEQNPDDQWDGKMVTLTKERGWQPYNQPVYEQDPNKLLDVKDEGDITIDVPKPIKDIDKWREKMPAEISEFVKGSRGKEEGDATKASAVERMLYHNPDVAKELTGVLADPEWKAKINTGDPYQMQAAVAEAIARSTKLPGDFKPERLMWAGENINKSQKEMKRISGRIQDIDLSIQHSTDAELKGSQFGQYLTKKKELEGVLRQKFAALDGKFKSEEEMKASPEYQQAENLMADYNRLTTAINMARKSLSVKYKPILDERDKLEEQFAQHDKIVSDSLKVLNTPDSVKFLRMQKLLAKAENAFPAINEAEEATMRKANEKMGTAEVAGKKTAGGLGTGLINLGSSALDFMFSQSSGLVGQSLNLVDQLSGGKIRGAASKQIGDLKTGIAKATEVPKFEEKNADGSFNASGWWKNRVADAGYSAGLFMPTIANAIATKGLGTLATNTVQVATTMGVMYPDYYQEGLQAGLTDQQAKMYAMAGSGLNAVIEQMLPVDKLLKIEARASIKSLVADYAKGGITRKQLARAASKIIDPKTMGVEYLEEVIQGGSDAAVAMITNKATGSDIKKDPLGAFNLETVATVALNVGALRAVASGGSIGAQHARNSILTNSLTNFRETYEALQAMENSFEVVGMTDVADRLSKLRDDIVGVSRMKFPEGMTQAQKVVIFEGTQRIAQLEAEKKGLSKTLQELQDQEIEKVKATMSEVADNPKKADKIIEESGDFLIQSLQNEGYFSVPESDTKTKQDGKGQKEGQEGLLTPEQRSAAIIANTGSEVDRIRELKAEDEDGATINPDGTRHTGGLVVPVASMNTTQEELTPAMIADFAQQHAKKLDKGKTFKLGIYKFPNSNKVSIDLNIVTDPKNREAALEFGRLAGQESIFDLDTFENIKTGATGENPMSFDEDQYIEIEKALSEGKVPEVFAPKVETKPEPAKEPKKVQDTRSKAKIRKQKEQVERVAKQLQAGFKKLTGEDVVVVTDQDEYDAELERQYNEGEIEEAVYKAAGKGSEGFVNADGEIFLNPRKFSTETPIHEFGHLWSRVAKKHRKDVYDKLQDVVRESKYFDDVKKDKNYKHLKDESDIIDEALARAIGEKGRDITDKALREKFDEFFKELMDIIRSLLGAEGIKNIEDLTLDEILEGINKEMFSGNLVLTTGDVITSKPDPDAKPNKGMQTMFMYVGEKYAEKMSEEMLHDLALAKAMYDSEDKTRVDEIEIDGDVIPMDYMDRIRYTTGWFLDPKDKKWRYELDNNNIIDQRDWQRAPDGVYRLISFNGIGVKQLLQAYPAISNIIVSKAKTEQDPQGFTYATTGMNAISVEYNPDMADIPGGDKYGHGYNILMHELQHVVQMQEGFARGSDPNNAENDLAQFAIQSGAKTVGDYNNLMQSAFGGRSQVSPLEVYARVSGEIEARNTERRTEMPFVTSPLNPEISIILEDPRFFDDVKPEDAITLFYQAKKSSSARTQFKMGDDLVEAANLDHMMTEDGEGNYVFFHHSGQKLNRIDPQKFGSNLATGRDEQPGVSISMYYTDPAKGESGVPSNYIHAVRIPKNKVYPFNADPLNFYDQAEKEFQERFPGRAFDPNKQVGFITKIAAENGYPMTVAKWNIGGKPALRAQTTQAMRPEMYREQSIDRFGEDRYNPKLEGIKVKGRKRAKTLFKMGEVVEDIEEPAAAEYRPVAHDGSYDLSFVKKEDLIDIKSLIKDISDRGQKVWFWVADQLGRGEYHDTVIDGTHYLDAGPSFALDPVNRKKGIVWATGKSEKWINDRTAESDYIFIISGSPYNSKLFNKRVAELTFSRMKKSIGEDGFWDKLKSGVLAVSNISDINSILEKHDSLGSLMESQDRKELLILFDKQKQKKGTELKKFLEEHNAFVDYDNLRDGFYRENDFRQNDIMLVLKPMGYGGKSDHMTYKNNVLGEVVGVPDHVINAFDILPREVRESYSDELGPSQKSRVIAKMGAHVSGVDFMISGVGEDDIRDIMHGAFGNPGVIDMVKSGMSDADILDEIETGYPEFIGTGVSQNILANAKRIAERPADLKSEKHQFRKLTVNDISDDRKTRGMSVKQRVRRFLRNNFNMLTGAEKVIRSEKESRDGLLDNVTRKAQRDAKAIYEKAKKLGYSDYDTLKKAMGVMDDMNKNPAVNDAMRRAEQKKALAQIPKELVPMVIRMRSAIDAISRELIEKGYVSPDQAINISNNEGLYVTRAYRIFENSEWVKNLKLKVGEFAGIYKAAVAHNANKLIGKALSELGQNATEDQVLERAQEMAKREIDAFLDEVDQAFKGASAGDKRPLETLQQRQDIPEELREFYGEYADPFSSFMMTILKNGELLATSRMLESIRKNGMGTFLKTTPDKEHYKRISAEDNPALQPLDGLYTSEDVYSFLMDPVKSGSNNLYMKAVGAMRWGKVVGNPITQIKNFSSNIWPTIRNGYFRLGNPIKGGGALDYFVNQLRQERNRKDLGRMIDEIDELNLLNQGVGIREIRRYFQDKGITRFADDLYDMVNNPMKPQTKMGAVSKAVKKGAAWVISGFNRTFQLGDDFWKVHAFMNEAHDYAQALYGKPYLSLTDDERKEVNAVAAENVKSLMPYYDRAYGAIREWTRMLPFLTNFFTFTAESVRTTINLQRTIARELLDPRTRGIAMKRMAGSIAYLSLRGGVNYAMVKGAGAAAQGFVVPFVEKMLGVDDDDEKDKTKNIKRFLFPFLKNNDIGLVDEGDGVFQVTDISSADPFNFMAKITNAAADKENLGEGLAAAIGETMGPIFEPEILISALDEVRRNSDSRGFPIYNEEDDPGDIAQMAMKHVWKKAQPGLLTNITRMAEREGSQEEIIAQLSGVRTYTLDINRMFNVKIKDATKRIANAKSIMIKDWYKAEDEEQKDAILQDTEASMMKILDDIKADYEAAINLGVDPKKLDETIGWQIKMKWEDGWNRDMMKYIKGQDVEGVVKPPKEKK